MFRDEVVKSWLRQRDVSRCMGKQDLSSREMPLGMLVVECDSVLCLEFRSVPAQLQMVTGAPLKPEREP